jgi:ketosteroid isomerase-like protein
VFVSKDINRILEFYDDSAIFINTDGKAYRGIEEIRKIWIEILATPGYSCNWHTADVIVAKSGDIGYTIGPWEVSLINKSGEQKTYHGTNVIVWKKQPNGTWKVIVDKS